MLSEIFMDKLQVQNSVSQIVEIPLAPLTINKCFRSISKKNFTSTIKTKRYRNFEIDVKNHLKKNNYKIKTSQNMVYSMHYKFYYPVLVKALDRVSKVSGDVFNMIKPIEDIVTRYFGFDDSQVIYGSCEKIHNDNPKIEILITGCDFYDYYKDI